MELRSTGGWLVSTVILNLVLLAGDEGTHTKARGRMNLDWRTLGQPKKVYSKHKEKKFNSTKPAINFIIILYAAFIFCIINAFS